MTRRGATAEADASTGTGPRALRAVLEGAGVQARAVFRVFAAIAVGGMLLANTSKNESFVATVVPLLAGLYVLATTGFSVRHDRASRRRRRDDALLRRRVDLSRAVLDIAAICAVVLSVNEPRVAILLVLCAIPLGYGLTLPASSVAGLTAVAIAGCLVVWATGPLIDAPAISEGELLLVAFVVTWGGLVACLIAIERERRAERIHKLSASVREMLSQALRAEANERSRVADLLHDDVLQLLLSTRHDIAEAIDGDLDLLHDARSGLESATRRLRETIVALRDDGEDGSVSEALHSMAGEAHGATVEVEVSSGLEALEHPVLVAAARDLLRDAESSTGAARVTITAGRDGDLLVLVIRHDDRRFALGLEVTPEAAELVGDVAARIHALDGTLDVRHRIDGQRVITIRVPARSGSRSTDPEYAPLSPTALDASHKFS